MRTLRTSILLILFCIKTISIFANLPEQKTDTTLYTGVDSVDIYPTFIYKNKINKDGLCEFYADSLRYPQIQDCMGNVVVKFFIEKNANLTDIKIYHEMPGCNEFIVEALRLVRLMNGLWKPAIKGKDTVRYEMIIPVIFKSSGCEESK